MNIFKKALIVALSVGLISVPTVTKEVSANTTDDSKEKWSLIGTVNGSNWDKDFALNYDQSDDRYEIEVDLKANEQFKIRLNNAWTTSIGYGSNTGAGISTYLSNSGGNFKVKSTGYYLLWVKDDKVANYDDKSYGFGIDPLSKEYTIKFVTGTSEEIPDSKVQEGSIATLPTPKSEGYKFEGWYTDSNYTTKYDETSKVTSDFTLFAKWGEYQAVIAEYNNVIYYENTKNWTNVYCYTWSDADIPVAWPGIKMNLLEGNTYWTNVAEGQVNIIFNDGGANPKQTKDLKIGNNNYFSYETGSEKSIESTVYFQRQNSLAPNSSDIRFVGTFSGELADYEEVGFVFGSLVETKYKTIRKSTKNVYESVIANGQEVNASEYGASYVFVVTISGVPAGQTFDVTPYAKTANGYVYGTAKTFVVQNA